MKKLFTKLLAFVSLIVIGTNVAMADDEVVYVSYDGNATVKTIFSSNSHNVDGKSSGKGFDSAPTTSASDGQIFTGNGAKLGKTSNFGKNLSSKDHIHFNMSAGETIRVYVSQTNGDSKTAYRLNISDYTNGTSAIEYKDLTVPKNGIVFCDFQVSQDGTYAISNDDATSVGSITVLATKFTAGNTPSISATSPASITATESGVEATSDITVKGANLTGSTLTATLSPAVSGLSVTLASYTITSGAISTTATLHYTATENAQGTTTLTLSDGTTSKDVTVNYSADVEASTKCVLSHVEFSNGFDAFINEDDETVIAYYMEGESVPAIAESSIEISEGATYTIEGSTFTVLAEDRVTKKDYTITLSSVTPTVEPKNEMTFDGTETWIKTGYGWDGTKGWKFAKNVDEESNHRIIEGKNRLYFYVGPATEFTLINTGVDNDRNIKVYVNGVEQTGITKIGKKSGNSNSISITGLSTTNNNLIAIVSNQTGGDGGFTKYTYTPVSVPVTIGTAGYATYVTPCAVDFTDNAIKAYYVSAVTSTAATLVPATQVPAGEAIIVEGTTGTVPVIASAAAIPNLMMAATTAIPFDAEAENINYVLADGSNGIGFYEVNAGTIAAGKGYLPVSKNSSPAKGLKMSFGDTVTGISTINNATNAVAEGKFIENGRIVIVKNGKKYNVAGMQK